jgi:hypothetical protein
LTVKHYSALSAFACRSSGEILEIAGACDSVAGMIYAFHDFELDMQAAPELPQDWVWQAPERRPT